MKAQTDPDASWQFFTADGSLIGTLPPHFHVNAWVFELLMSAHKYAWTLPYARG